MKSKEGYSALNNKLAELTDEELAQVTGGHNSSLVKSAAA